MVEFMETMLVLVQLVLEGVLLEEALAVREEDVGQRVVGLPVVHYTARHINIPIVGLGFVFVISYVHQQIYKNLFRFWALFIAFELARQSTRLDKSHQFERRTS